MVCDLHLLQNRGTVVRDCDIAVGGDEDLVEAAGAEGALDDVGYCAGGQDMCFDGLVAELPLLGSLTTRSISFPPFVCVCQRGPWRCTYSLTMMNGRPCSSFIIVAVVILVSHGTSRQVYLARTVRQI